jgi:hypothetical protein
MGVGLAPLGRGGQSGGGWSGGGQSGDGQRGGDRDQAPLGRGGRDQAPLGRYPVHPDLNPPDYLVVIWGLLARRWHGLGARRPARRRADGLLE